MHGNFAFLDGGGGSSGLTNLFIESRYEIQMSLLYHKKPPVQDPEKRYCSQNDYDEDYQRFVRLHYEYPFPNSALKSRTSRHNHDTNMV
jgi:hypothetical protein